MWNLQELSFYHSYGQCSKWWLLSWTWGRNRIELWPKHEDLMRLSNETIFIMVLIGLVIMAIMEVYYLDLPLIKNLLINCEVRGAASWKPPAVAPLGSIAAFEPRLCSFPIALRQQLSLVGTYSGLAISSQCETLLKDSLCFSALHCVS